MLNIKQISRESSGDETLNCIRLALRQRRRRWRGQLATLLKNGAVELKNSAKSTDYEHLPQDDEGIEE